MEHCISVLLVLKRFSSDANLNLILTGLQIVLTVKLLKTKYKQKTTPMLYNK